MPVQTTESASNLFHKAAASGSLAILERLILQKQVAIDVVDNKGNTALHKAAWHGKLEAVRILVKHGAKLGVANSSSKTALAFANQMGHNDCAEYLLEMMQRHSPEKIKSMFRSKGKTSNCARVFGPRASMKATAWLIPGAPEVEVQDDERAMDRAISAANQHNNAPVTVPAQPRSHSAPSAPVAPSPTSIYRAPSVKYNAPSPREQPLRLQSAGANTLPPPASPSDGFGRAATYPAPMLPAHHTAPAVVCTVSSTPGAAEQRSHQTHYSNQQHAQSPSALRTSPPMPKLDLSGLKGANKPAEEEVLSGRSTSRREEMPEGMWTEEASAAQRKPSTPHARPPSGSHFTSPRSQGYAMPVGVERVVQGAGGQVRVVQVAQRGGMPVRVSPSFALV